MSLSKIVQAEIEDETSRSCMSAVDQTASGLELPEFAVAAFMILQLQHLFQHPACSRQAAKLCQTGRKGEVFITGSCPQHIKQHAARLILP